MERQRSVSIELPGGKAFALRISEGGSVVSSRPEHDSHDLDQALLGMQLLIGALVGDGVVSTGDEKFREAVRGVYETLVEQFEVGD